MYGVSVINGLLDVSGSSASVAFSSLCLAAASVDLTLGITEELDSLMSDDYLQPLFPFKKSFKRGLCNAKWITLLGWINQEWMHQRFISVMEVKMEISGYGEAMGSFYHWIRNIQISDLLLHARG